MHVSLQDARLRFYFHRGSFPSASSCLRRRRGRRIRVRASKLLFIGCNRIFTRNLESRRRDKLAASSSSSWSSSTPHSSCQSRAWIHVIAPWIERPVGIFLDAQSRFFERSPRESCCDVVVRYSSAGSGQNPIYFGDENSCSVSRNKIERHATLCFPRRDTNAGNP